MANKAFETGDLVWAKMKTYPLWPARIVDPPEHIKSPTSKKGKHCVCFFGTNDFAWIPDDRIVPHTEERALATKSKTKTSVALLKAIKEITEYGNTSPENATSLDSESESDASKNDSDNDASTELSPTSPEKVEKKFKKREKRKKQNFDSFSSSERTPSPLEKENDAEVSSSENSQEILKEQLTGENETKIRKKCNLTKSSSNESITASSEENSEDLFPSTSSDNEKEPKSESVYLDYTLAPCPEREEEEKIFEAKRLEKMNIEKLTMKRKIIFPEDENEIKKTDYGPPYRHFYECPKVPDIDMDKGNYLCAKDIKVIDKKIGFLGINQMSAGILKNLLLSGHNVTIYSENYNLESYQPYMEVGANVAQTADDVVASCDITFGYLGDINAVKHLMYANFGILKGLEGCAKGSKGYIEMTPIDVTTALEFQKAFSFYGMKYMIAPVVGSRQIADEGSVLCLAAGDVELFTECYSCFSSFSRNVYYVHSDLEAGVQMYLIQSMLIGTTTAALAEAIALIKKCNLSFDSFYELIEMGPFSCQLALEKSNLMNSRNFAPNSTLNNQLIDMKMALKLANANHQATAVTAAAHELFKRAKFLNYTNHDVSSVVMGTEIEMEDC